MTSPETLLVCVPGLCWFIKTRIYDEYLGLKKLKKLCAFKILTENRSGVYITFSILYVNYIFIGV